MSIFKKISAFTLTEMLLVLAITAIVVSLAFSILNMFGRNIQLIQNNYSRSTQLALFENQLSVDFNRFHSIKYELGSRELHLKTPLDSVQYTFSDEFIVRELDTVLVAKNGIELFYSGAAIVKGKTDAIKFTFPKGTTSSFLFIYKENDAFHYLTQNGN